MNSVDLLLRSDRPIPLRGPSATGKIGSNSARGAVVGRRETGRQGATDSPLSIEYRRLMR
jgi:hypothetical protein